MRNKFKELFDQTDATNHTFMTSTSSFLNDKLETFFCKGNWNLAKINIVSTKTPSTATIKTFSKEFLPHYKLINTSVIEKLLENAFLS